MQLAAWHKKGPALHVVALLLGEGLTVIALALFAYLGTFTRYLAADYCEAMQVANGGVWKALAWRYQHASDRFSNLLFDALSELLAPRNVRIVPVAMIALWTVALVWLVHQAGALRGCNGRCLWMSSWEASWHSFPSSKRRTAVMPALLFSTLIVGDEQLDAPSRRSLTFAVAAVPVLMLAMIAASFGPSVYGQSFPSSGRVSRAA